MSNFNRNPMGRNQYARVLPAEDPELIAALVSYHRQGKTSNKKISQLLEIEHNILMSDSTVKRRRRELKLQGSRVTTRDMPFSEKLQLVLNELDNDPSRHHGVDNIRYRIAFNHGVHLTRDFISDIMHTQDPAGFDLREPTAKKIHRTVKAPIGIHERWSGDGHDKLYGIGFPIYGVVDESTGKWLGSWVVPSNRLGLIVGYLYLSLVLKYSGMPLQFTTDCGSETTQAFALGNALRSIFHPEINSEILPPHSYLRSVHNISIERSWLRLRLDWGNNTVEVFQYGVENGLYNATNPQQYELCQWLWSKLLQSELNTFMEYRNGVPMRKDKNKAGPSGRSRNDAFAMPQTWGGRNCLLPVDRSVISEMMETLGGNDLLSFVPLEFATRAQQAYDNLGLSVNMSNVWLLFQNLLTALYPQL